MRELPKKERKPIHVAKKSKGDDITDDILHLERTAAYEEAEKKAIDLSAHLGPDAELFITADEDDDEFKYYVNVRLSF